MSFLLILATTACAGFPFLSDTASREHAKSITPGQVEIELQEPRFDGYDLTGRFMIGVVSGAVRLDKRLIEEVSINLDTVTDCATDQALSVFVADRFPPPATQEDLLVLEQGYWYGAEVYFPLLPEGPESQPGPECIEIAFVLRSFDGQIIGKTRVQAHREVPPSPGPDAGIQAP